MVFQMQGCFTFLRTKVIKYQRILGVGSATAVLVIGMATGVSGTRNGGVGPNDNAITMAAVVQNNREKALVKLSTYIPIFYKKALITIG